MKYVSKEETRHIGNFTMYLCNTLFSHFSIACGRAMHCHYSLAPPHAGHQSDHTHTHTAVGWHSTSQAGFIAKSANMVALVTWVEVRTVGSPFHSLSRLPQILEAGCGRTVQNIPNHFSLTSVAKVTVKERRTENK